MARIASVLRRQAWCVLLACGVPGSVFAQEIDEIFRCTVPAGCTMGEDCIGDTPLFILIATMPDGQKGAAVTWGTEGALADMAPTVDDGRYFRIRPRPGMPQVTAISLWPSGRALVSISGDRARVTYEGACVLEEPET